MSSPRVGHDRGLGRVGWMHLALTCASALGSPAVFAQAPTTGHEGHEAQLAAAASKTTPSARHVMSPQPLVGDVPLVDQEGRATSLRQALETDMPVLVNFIFTSCTTICPIMTTGFAQLQERLGAERDKVRLVSISIDPATDTSPTLRAYATRNRALASWQFLTGAAPAIEAAQRTFGAYRGDKSNHAPGTYLRRTRDSPWEALDGLSSAQTLLGAVRGDGAVRGF
jgi:protein SCO1